jgi:GAF domain-containing protein
MLSTMVSPLASVVRTSRAPEADPEYVTLQALARVCARRDPRAHPLDKLQDVVDLARELTGAKYAALAVTNDQNRTEGFVVSGLDPATLRRLKVPPQGHGPLGTLRADGRPVRYDDLDAVRNAFGFPPKHPVMRTLMGAPIWVHGAVRGSLYVTDRDGGKPFRDRDEAVLLTLARHAANIVERDWY